MRKIYRELVILLLVLGFLYYLLPDLWPYIYDSATREVFVYQGFYSKINSNVYSYLWTLQIILIQVSLIGLLYFKVWARLLYTLMIAVSVMMAPLSGVSISGGWDAMLGALLTLGDGIILSMSYISGVAHEFGDIKKSAKRRVE